MRMFEGRRGVVTGSVIGLAMMFVWGGAVWAAPGDLVLRVGAAHVAPNDDSGELTGLAGAKVGVDNTSSLGITLGYMFGERLGIGLLAAWPFEHDIVGRGVLDGAGTLATVKHLPPTLTLQYHFAPEAGVRPFIGAGFNYTRFFSEKTEGALDGTDIELDDSWGWAAEVGVDVDVAGDWFLSGQIFYLAMDTRAELGGGLGGIEVDIDPWVFMAGIGRTF